MQVEGIEVPTGNHRGRLVVIGSDHRGFLLKDMIKKHLMGKGFKVLDVGCRTPDRCDYPEISAMLGREVGKDLSRRAGMGICGSGIGILIPAGKMEGIIPARCLSLDDARSSRRHNNSNVIGLAADLLTPEAAMSIVDVWMDEPFYMSSADDVYLKRYLMTRKMEKQAKD
jgi:RpiB/LacA/LacB family sugar-phosphate isomerase